MSTAAEYVAVAWARLQRAWAVMPRKLKYWALGILLASISQKFPGFLPSVDPEWYIGGGGALALMHTVTDMRHGGGVVVR